MATHTGINRCTKRVPVGPRRRSRQHPPAHIAPQAPTLQGHQHPKAAIPSHPRCINFHTVALPDLSRPGQHHRGSMHALPSRPPDPCRTPHPHHTTRRQCQCQLPLRRLLPRRAPGPQNPRRDRPHPTRRQAPHHRGARAGVERQGQWYGMVHGRHDRGLSRNFPSLGWRIWECSRLHRQEVVGRRFAFCRHPMQGGGSPSAHVPRVGRCPTLLLYFAAGDPPPRLRVGGRVEGRNTKADMPGMCFCEWSCWRGWWGTLRSEVKEEASASSRCRGT